MFPRPTRWFGVVATTSFVLALTLLGCGGPGGPGSSEPVSTGPGSSGTAACPTAPTPPDNLAGWTPPSKAPAIVPVLINSVVVCGSNRILFTLLNASNTPVGSPNRTASIALYDLGRDPTKPIASEEGTFVWAIKDERGIYVADATFPEAGRYGAEVTTTSGGQTDTQRLVFDVQPSSPVIRVGDKVPASKTPTLTDVGGDVTHISTDTSPDPAFYKTSVDQALAKKEPFVLIFATPKFCTSAQCGPTLDSIKPFVARYPTVTFINVEPYKLKLVDGTLQADLDAAGALQPTAVTDEWHLLNEPTVYIVNRDGVVTANFDLIFSDAELTAALDAVK